MQSVTEFFLITPGYTGYNAFDADDYSFTKINPAFKLEK